MTAWLMSTRWDPRGGSGPGFIPLSDARPLTFSPSIVSGLSVRGADPPDKLKRLHINLTLAHYHRPRNRTPHSQVIGDKGVSNLESDNV